MADKHNPDTCPLCAGSGEVAITPAGEPDSETGVYGCPICIAAERDAEIADLNANIRELRRMSVGHIRLEGEPSSETARYAHAVEEVQRTLDFRAEAIEALHKEVANWKAWAEARRKKLSQLHEKLRLATMTPEQISVLRQLIELARVTNLALDDSEELHNADGRVHLLSGAGFDAISQALDALEALPDDRPEYTMNAAGKAEWALRGVLPPPKEGDMNCDTIT